MYFGAHHIQIKCNETLSRTRALSSHSSDVMEEARLGLSFFSITLALNRNIDICMRMASGVFLCGTRMLDLPMRRGIEGIVP